ncbi:hypothetical protein AB0A63_03115 [Lentzea sp. NPDC042327]|uniref:hypothetical protein n=1 Tax=Lentzea sp. NPDC042327 TaxID=3154801 RepID=UPI0033D5EAE5
MTVHLDDAVTSALTHLRTGAPGPAVQDLREALSLAGAVPPQALACVRAADDHLAHGELMEARTLLTVAHRLLAQSGTGQPAVVLPSQAVPPTTPIRV